MSVASVTANATIVSNGSGGGGGLQRLLRTESGKIVISILLGLGLAALFRKACKDNRCLVIQGPNPHDVKNNYYKVNDDCYQYEPVLQECNHQH